METLPPVASRALPFQADTRIHQFWIVSFTIPSSSLSIFFSCVCLTTIYPIWCIFTSDIIYSFYLEVQFGCFTFSTSFSNFCTYNCSHCFHGYFYLLILICVSALVSIDLFSTCLEILISCFFACLVIFDWRSDIVNFIMLNAGYFCIPINILELYANIQLRQ